MTIFNAFYDPFSREVTSNRGPKFDRDALFVGSQRVWKSGMLLWLHKGFWPGVVFKYVFFRSRWMIAGEFLWAFEAAMQSRVHWNTLQKMLDEGWSDTFGGRPTTWWLCGPPTTKPSGPLVRRRYTCRDPGRGSMYHFPKWHMVILGCALISGRSDMQHFHIF